MVGAKEVGCCQSTEARDEVSLESQVILVLNQMCGFFSLLGFEWEAV